MTFSCEADFGHQGMLIEVDEGDLGQFMEQVEDRLADECENHPLANFRYGPSGIIAFEHELELDDDEIEHCRRAVLDVAESLGVSGRASNITTGGRKVSGHVN